MFVAFGVALALGAAGAHADERQSAKTAAREQAGGGTTSKEITGRVVQVSPSKLFVEHMGAVVEFNIAPDAQFSGGNVQTFRDLSEGQEVRTSFTIENRTTNVAKRISLAHETGPAGSQHGGAGSAWTPETGTGTTSPPPKR